MYKMPAETDPHERTWMAFPVAGPTLGETDAEKDECYRAWSDVALAVAEFEPVTMVVDPSEMARAKNMLGSDVELFEAEVDEFWMRDHGPTFVKDGDRLGAVQWQFNGWGAHDWAQWEKSAKHGKIIAEAVGAELISSKMVNEGGGIHVDGEGTVFVTETVQLDPRRNPGWVKDTVEEELMRTLGVKNIVWVSRGLTRDYEEFGTNGHIDIIAAVAAPGTLLLHAQNDEAHPDFAVMPAIKRELEDRFKSLERDWQIIEIPAPRTLKDAEGFVDWSYINHLAVNGGVIACSFGDEYSDAEARDLLSQAYDGRTVKAVDARPLFDRGGGVHCITQQQPSV